MSGVCVMQDPGGWRFTETVTHLVPPTFHVQVPGLRWGCRDKTGLIL